MISSCSSAIAGPDPLLKWPGGKRWVAPLLASLLRQELSGTYFEPMLGSGAVFLKLAPTSAHLADMNADEAALAADPYQRKNDIHQKLVAECKALALKHHLT